MGRLSLSKGEFDSLHRRAAQDELADYGPRLATKPHGHREELSNGNHDSLNHRARAHDRVVGSVLSLVYPSRKSPRTHLVHMVEAAGALRHRARRGRGPSDSTRG